MDSKGGGGLKISKNGPRRRCKLVHVGGRGVKKVPKTVHAVCACPLAQIFRETDVLHVFLKKEDFFS